MQKQWLRYISFIVLFESVRNWIVLCSRLLDEKKCRDTEFRYGLIKGKYVIYRGETAELKDVSEETTENVTYLNVEDFGVR